MTRVLAMLAMAAALLTACDDNPPDTEQTRRCDPEVDRAFRAWADAGFSGTVAISTGGEFDCLAGYGPANQATGAPNTAATVFSIGSVTKAFTAAAVLDLVDAGKLSLHDRAGEIVPGLAGPAARATVEQLLLHTSGLTGSHGADHVPLDHDGAVAAIGRLERAFAPGSDFLYSNAGYTLLALIVEEVSGTTYREYTASRILRGGGFWDGKPAARGPRAVGYLERGPTDEMGDFGGPHWALDGNGGLAMTMRDLASWTHELFTTHSEWVTAHRFDRGDGTSETPGWVAFDDSVYGQPMFATAGGGGDVGHNAVVAWIPRSERVVAIASNTAAVTAEELLQAVGPALVAGEPLPRPEIPAGGATRKDMAAVAGTYELAPGASFRVAARDDRLAISAHGARAVAALFAPPEEAAAHERRVMDLLKGETEERRSLEGSIGPIEDMALAGTVVADGELRTYVSVRSAQASILAWYALDEAGGVAAAEGPTEPPELLLVPAGGGRYRPDDPARTGPDVTVAFERRRMTISGPAATVSARRNR